MSNLAKVHELLKKILTGKGYYGEVVIVIRDSQITAVRKVENCLLANQGKNPPAGTE